MARPGADTASPPPLTDADLRDPVEDVAQRLLGCTLVGRDCAGVIVETEAYHQDEQACHAWKGRTPRTEQLFAASGTAYVYFTYGMHWCFNVVSEPDGIGAAVLIRALQPTHGLELMHARRERARRPGSPPLADRHLCSGPAKLVQALDIRAADNGVELVGAYPTTAAALGDSRRDQPTLLRDAANVRAAGVDPASVVIGPRIGISVATELPWRFGVAGNRWVSKPFAS